MANENESTATTPEAVTGKLMNKDKEIIPKTTTAHVYDMSDASNPQRLDNILTNMQEQIGDGVTFEASNEPTVSVPVDADMLDGHTVDYFETAADSENKAATLSNRITRTNLLDNWYFLDVVNQRGESSYTDTTNSGIYCIDRWKIGRGTTLNVNNDIASITTTPKNDGSTPFILQILPYRYDELVNHNLTLSVLDSNGNLYTGTGTVEGAKPTTGSNPIYIEIRDISIPISIHLVYSIALGMFSVAMYFSSVQPTSFLPIAFKLEFGDTQTLAVKGTDNKWIMKDAIPNKAQTLYECSKYLQSVIVPARISTFNTSNGKLDYTHELNPPMRTVPSFIGNVPDYVKVTNRNGVSNWLSNNSGTFTSTFSFAPYWKCKYVGFSYIVDSSDKENVGTYRIIVGNDEYPNPLVSAEL